MFAQFHQGMQLCTPNICGNLSVFVVADGHSLSYRYVRSPRGSTSDEYDRSFSLRSHIRKKRVRHVQLTEDIHVKLLLITLYTSDRVSGFLFCTHRFWRITHPISSVIPSKQDPALFTRTSMRPHFSITSPAEIRNSENGAVTSSFIVCTLETVSGLGLTGIRTLSVCLWK